MIQSNHTRFLTLALATFLAACGPSDGVDAGDAGRDVLVTNDAADASSSVDAADASQEDSSTMDAPSMTDASADQTSPTVDAAADATADVTADATADVTVDATADVTVDATDAAADTAPAAQDFQATLSGTQEVPPAISTASGTGAFSFNPTTRVLTYTVTHTVASPTAGHIHRGSLGTNGPVVVPFASPASPVTGTATLSEADAASLLSGNLYVNIHTALYPGGEIRGQIVRR